MCRLRTHKGYAISELGQILGAVTLGQQEGREIDGDHIMWLLTLVEHHIQAGWPGSEFAELVDEFTPRVGAS